MYARFSSKGNLEVFRKSYVILDDVITVNPGMDVMRRAGYKPLVMRDAPTVGEGEMLSLDYIDTGDAIEGVYSVIGG